MHAWAESYAFPLQKAVQIARICGTFGTEATMAEPIPP